MQAAYRSANGKQVLTDEGYETNQQQRSAATCT